MRRIESTVFLSYRRADLGWALAIFQYLTAHGYDLFFDINGVASGDFERVIKANIKARAHFLVLLTPSALERCDEPDDWLRLEIEAALAAERNIVPLALEGFDFCLPSTVARLSGPLGLLRRYNALTIPREYFDESMQRLCEKYLNIPLEAVLHPAATDAYQATLVQRAAAIAVLSKPGELSSFVANVRTEPSTREHFHFDPSGLERVERELAIHVGPIAKVLVKRAAKRAASWTELYTALACEIEAHAERDQFYRSVAAMQKPPAD